MFFLEQFSLSPFCVIPREVILEINNYAIFIPCGEHFLNLFGTAAVNSCLDAVNFFLSFKEYIRFFHHRRIGGKSVPKDLSDTRWQAHNKAVSAINTFLTP